LDAVEQAARFVALLVVPHEAVNRPRFRRRVNGPPLPGDLWLRLCPTCQGSRVEVGSCPTCGGAGVLDQNDEPFRAPPPFAGWHPVQLVALSDAARARDRRHRELYPFTNREGWRMSRNDQGEAVAVREAPRRLSLSEIVELLLTRSAADHSTVKLTRNAKGDTQIEVSIRTGEAGLDTPELARAKAEETYDHLCRMYPPSGPKVGT
jgi:hypothetical protein